MQPVALSRHSLGFGLARKRFAAEKNGLDEDLVAPHRSPPGEPKSASRSKHSLTPPAAAEAHNRGCDTNQRAGSVMPSVPGSTYPASPGAVVSSR